MIEKGLIMKLASNKLIIHLSGTIVGKVTALDFDDGRHGQIFYAIIANKFIEMDDYFSEILVKRNLLGDLLEEVELEIAAFGGKINRFSNIQPDM